MDSNDERRKDSRKLKSTSNLSSHWVIRAYPTDQQPLHRRGHPPSKIFVLKHHARTNAFPPSSRLSNRPARPFPSQVLPFPSKILVVKMIAVADRLLGVNTQRRREDKAASVLQKSFGEEAKERCEPAYPHFMPFFISATNRPRPIQSTSDVFRTQTVPSPFP